MERCPEPKFECLDRGICYLDKNHKFWPRRMYLGKVATMFRNLPENIEYIPRCEHDKFHAETLPPPKPTNQEMLDALRRNGL